MTKWRDNTWPDIYTNDDATWTAADDVQWFHAILIHVEPDEYEEQCRRVSSLMRYMAAENIE